MDLHASALQSMGYWETPNEIAFISTQISLTIRIPTVALSHLLRLSWLDYSSQTSLKFCFDGVIKWTSGWFDDPLTSRAAGGSTFGKSSPCDQERLTFVLKFHQNLTIYANVEYIFVEQPENGAYAV